MEVSKWKSGDRSISRDEWRRRDQRRWMEMEVSVWMSGVGGISRDE